MRWGRYGRELGDEGRAGGVRVPHSVSKPGKRKGMEVELVLSQKQRASYEHPDTPPRNR